MATKDTAANWPTKQFNHIADFALVFSLLEQKKMQKEFIRSVVRSCSNCIPSVSDNVQLFKLFVLTAAVRSKITRIQLSKCDQTFHHMCPKSRHGSRNLVRMGIKTTEDGTPGKSVGHLGDSDAGTGPSLVSKLSQCLRSSSTHFHLSVCHCLKLKKCSWRSFKATTWLFVAPVFP